MLDVVRMLYDRKKSIVTNPEDRDLEEQHINSARKVCGYLEYVLKRSKYQMGHKEQTKSRTTKKADNIQNATKKPMKVLSYIRDMTEATQQVL